MILKGRKKITCEYSSEDLMDLDVLATVINTSMKEHLINKTDIDYLTEYSKGSQEILGKIKLIRPEINNTLVLNHAQMITRNIVGYFLGTPIQYIQNGNGNKEDVDYLNRVVSYEDKSSVDKEIGDYQSITGTAYRIIYTDGVYADAVPFEEKALKPESTYVVYENSIAERPVVGVTFHDVFDDLGLKKGTRVYAYTTFGVYTILTDIMGRVDGTSEMTLEDYNVGGVPIIEYPNNMWRLGDWELCLGLMDAINALQSGRLDDIDQIIQSLLIFINADIDTEIYDEMRASGVVLLKNTTNLQTDVKNIVNSLDQSGLNMFADELKTLLYALVGVPDRNARSGGGGDTGQAVELRDGWADLEIVARNKELTYKKSEKMALVIMLSILNNKGNRNIQLMDVDIKFTRNKNNNLLVKTQSYQTLLETKTLTPEDCLTIVDLVSDVNEFVSRGKAFWGTGFAGNEPVKPVLLNDTVEKEVKV